MSTSLPSLPRPLHHFYDTVEITNPPTVQAESVSGKELCADALYGPGGYETLSWDWNLRNWAQKQNCEEMVRGELEAMERTLVTRYSININNSKSQSENIKDRQEMPSIRLCRIFRKLWRSDDARHSRYPESIWRTNGRKLNASGTNDWIRSTRSVPWWEKPYVTKTSRTSPNRRKRPDALGAAVTRRYSSKSLIRTRSSKRASFQSFPNLEHNEAQLRVH